MQRGKVKWFNTEKGFGFIVPEDGTKDVFVHRNNVNGLGWEEGLVDGEEVEYEVEKYSKRLECSECSANGLTFIFLHK